MSAAAEVYVLERRAVLDRLRWTGVHLTRHPKLILGTAVAGMLGTFVAMLSVLSVPRVGQVHMYWRAKLLSDRFAPGHETIEARLFAESEIPWDEIAFKTVHETLKCYFADRRAGAFRVHVIDIT